MRMIGGWLLRLACLGILLLGAPANAGPYFNSANKKVKELSQAAIKYLSDSRIAAINMLSELDAGHMDKANEYRKTAMQTLQKSIEGLSEIQSIVPNQEIRYSNFKSEEERKIISEFASALKPRGKGLPKSEKELAQLAVDTVKEYASVIEGAKLEGFPKQWQSVRRIILSDSELQNIGNLASVVWTVSEQ